MIKFKESIFFGREDCLEKCYLLHKRLEEAFNIMSGLQQPDHSANEKIAKESEYLRSDSEKELYDIGIDLITAIGLYDYVFGNPEPEYNEYD